MKTVIRAGALGSRRLSVVALAAAAIALTASMLAAQTPARVLGREEILLYGLGLRVEPAAQVVPKNIATIVSTYLQAPSDPGTQLPAFAPDAEIRATLRGPSLQIPVDLVAKPNSPFTIPPLAAPGLHTLDNIRFVSGGHVLLYGTPESVSIEVIEKLLVTQVTARPLTAAEIKERGLVFDSSSYQAYNFSAAFAISEQPVKIAFPVVLPKIAGAEGVPESGNVILPQIRGPGLSLPMLLPDTLKIQALIPNLSVTGFVLQAGVPADQQFMVPPIPGVVVIPGDIGFLNQVFSVMLMVANVAPSGSNLVVSDLQAEIVLPAGYDDVAGSADDPLRMGRTAEGECPRIRIVAQSGPDGQFGSPDDILTLGPGETGNAEYIVEGRREGSAVVEMAFSGTLTGLPIGPVPITGRAAGSVLVRNPKFTLTFTHPDVVSAGEQYTLDATVTNTSTSPANFVSVNLYGANVSGATLVGEGTREIEYIAPGDSATVSFTLVSKRSGRVTAATMDSDENVAGRFALKTAVGELGIPLSPDSLVLPKEASSLPPGVREAALGLLGKAHAVATAPPAALPKDVQRFTRNIVWDRAIEVAQAGMRVSLHEPVTDSVVHLAMDVLGNNRARLAELHPKPDDLAFVTNDFDGFDALRRASVGGDTFAAAVAAVLGPEVERLGVAPFHTALAQQLVWRPGHISVLIGGTGGPLPVRLALVDAAGRRVTDTTAGSGKVTKEIPYSDLLQFIDGANLTGQLAIVASPDAGAFTIRLEREPGVPDAATFTLSVVAPDGAGGLRQYTFTGLAVTDRPDPLGSVEDPFRFTFELLADGAVVEGRSVAAPPATAIPDPPPTVLGVVQQAEADLLHGDTIEIVFGRPGRVIAVLFSEEVTPESVQDRMSANDITHYAPEENAVVGVALQPGRRIAFLALRDPVGPFVARAITMSDIVDRAGQAMASQTAPIETTVTDEAGVVFGQVLNTDGTPLAFANVRLFYDFWRARCQSAPNPLVPGALVWQECLYRATFGISSKTADDQGRFSWDYVLKLPVVRIVAYNADTDEYQTVRVTIARDGQRLNVNLPFLGRGTLKGRTLAEDGVTPLVGTSVLVTSLTDQSEYYVLTDSTGAFEITKIPVGNVLIEAVNPRAAATVRISERIPFAGAEITRDIVLIDVDLAPPVERGRVTGYVLQADGTTVVQEAQVIAYYREDGRYPVRCPGDESAGIPECAIAVTRTDALGAFVFEQVPPGSLRIYAFDQPTLMQGDAVVELAPAGSVSFNLLLAGGLGTVVGTVVDAAGQGVAGARVGGGLSLTTTDAAGHFTLVDVPVGHRELAAVSDALQTTGRIAIDIARPGETVSATIVLEASGTFTGVVRDSSGAPIAGLDVYLMERPPPFVMHGERYDIVVRQLTTTDSLGRYRFERIPAGEYRLSAFNPDFTDGNLTDAALSYQGQVVTANISFRGRGHIHGVVLDADGHTPLKAAVGLSGDQLVIAGGKVGVGFEYIQNHHIVETTLEDGAFTLNGVWGGAFTLRAAGQFSPDPIVYEGTMPSTGGEMNLTLRLQPTSEIRGTVFQPDGVTPVGGNVIVRYKSDAFVIKCIVVGFGDEAHEECYPYPQGIQEETAVTDAQGRFWLPVVNAGSFTLTIEDPVSGRVGETRGAVRAGASADVPVRLLGTGLVTVQVLGSDAVTPIPGARVTLTQIAFPKRSLEFIADGQGLVLFSGADALSEGEFVVVAVDLRDGFAGRAAGRVSRDGEQVLVRVFLYNASGTVSGVVYKAGGLEPAANVQVIVSNPHGPLAYAMTDAAGGYSVDTIPLGDFSVATFNPATAGRAYASGRIDLDRQEVAVNLTEMAVCVVRGTVVDAATLEPLKGWSVALNQQTSSGRDVPTLITTSGVDGGFSFPGATVGAFSLSVWTSGVSYVPTSMPGELTRPAEAVDLVVPVSVLHPAYGRIEGLVSNPDGSPAGNSQVDIGASGLSQSLVADAGGTFVVEDVPVGRFRIVARAQVTGNVGSHTGELRFDGETAKVAVGLFGLSRVSGTVVRGDGSPAAGAEVVLGGEPATGCLSNMGTPIDCTVYADATGAFTFLDVAAHTFTVTARDPVSNLKGATGGVLVGGESRVVRVVLEPSAAVRARVFFSNGDPAPAIVAELSRVVMGDLGPETQRLFVESGSAGVFEFATVAMDTWALVVRDPIGTGLDRRTLNVTGAIDLGDIVLDEAPPVVTGMTPAASATGVPRDQVISIVFSERVDPATVTSATIVLSEPAGAVTGLVDLAAGDTTATFTPLAPLKDQTRYTVRVSGVEDRLDKPMSAEYVASFTTIDVKPPEWSVVTPAPGTAGVTVETTVRVTFSEPIAVSRFGATPVRVSSAAGAVEGRTDYLGGNTIIVFSPRWPLSDSTGYRVQVDPAVDLSGNVQSAGLDFEFRTTDRTPPVVTGLAAANSATVIENSLIAITPALDAGHDVAYLDYYVNGVLTYTSRTAPFRFSLQATPSVGAPGDLITVWAVAVDTSGIRGVASSAVTITILPDATPVLAIIAPADGISARNGDRVTVTVRATDDLGVTQIAYRAATGRPQDALAGEVSPSALERTESFEFVVPPELAPGATIAIRASAVDTKGQVTDAAPVSIAVLDAFAPIVTITGATSGEKIRPGQSATVVVTAQDAGGVTAVTCAASGAASASESRTIDPAQNSVVTTFAVTASASAQPGDVVRLDATATDRAGNTGTAARVLLAVADAVPPTVRLRTESGSLDMAAGQTVTVIADGNDETGVTRIDLSGQGAFQVADTQAVSPPSGSPSARFTINVPAGLAPGATLVLQARAFDVSGNASVPANLTLTAISVADVVLPATLVVLAGDSADLPVQLGSPAPAGGVTVGLRSADPDTAFVPSSVTFAEGEQVTSAVVTAVSGGIVQIDALIQGVPRATTTVTVVGGVVRGTVFDPDLNPVAGAQVSVKPYNRWETFTAETDSAGRYAVTGLVGTEYDPITSFTVTARDPDTQLIAYFAGHLTRPLGYATVNLVLLSAGMIRGTVLMADGASAGADVRVDLFAAGALDDPLSTTFTDALGAFEFPLVSAGDYVIDASDGAGNLGRSNAHIGASGDEVTVPITFLGRGVVTGIVRDGAGSPVPNAQVQIRVVTALGYLPPTSVSADLDGRYRFEGVYVGTFTLTATDPVSGQGATATGAVTANLQEVSFDIALKPAAHLLGTVFRSDGTTPVGPDVSVTFTWCWWSGQYPCSVETTTDVNGQYQLRYLPLVTFHVLVHDSATRGLGFASGTLGTSGETRTLNITLYPQGTIVATVVGEGGVALAGASVHVDASIGEVVDTVNGTSGTDGQVIFQHVLAGNFTAEARLGGVTGTVTGTLASGEIKQITIPLEPSASLAGHVYEPDGATPVGAGRAEINFERYPYSHVTMTLVAGAFRFDQLHLGTYTLRVWDAQNRLRAIARGVSLLAAGEVVTRDFTMIGLGTVVGRVLNPDSSSAADIEVRVQSLTPDLGNILTVRTDAAGYYSASDVVVGAVAVKAGNPSQYLLGEASGTLASHGGTVTVDILLANNSVNLPVYRYDANSSSFQIHPSGAISGGAANVFGGYYDETQRSFLLDLIPGGDTLPFTGGTIGTMEDREQEIAVRQEGLAGLNVTRKAYVAGEGYFVRYLEILSNPSASPITVGVRVHSHLAAEWGTAHIITTSNGDAALAVADPDDPDRWLTVDDLTDGDSQDAISTSTGPPLAFVFDGPGARLRASAATFAAGPVGQLVYEWQNVTVPAGGTVILMHFGAQQTSRAAAALAGERLAQLPPEAMAGMSPAEMAAVVNFAVPADGHSSLEPLPAMGGTITGRVLAPDLVTAVQSADVYYKSDHPLFARRRLVNDSDSDGRFTVVPESWDYWKVPLHPFTLVAYEWYSELSSPPAAGAFASGETTATQDIVFSNAGMISGVVRRHTGDVVSSGQVTLKGTSPAFSNNTSVESDGRYAFNAVPPGSLTLQAKYSSIPSPIASVTIAAGERLTADLTLVPTGSLDLTLTNGSGAVAVSQRVLLMDAGTMADVAVLYTDTSGRAVFSEVPAATYILYSQNKTSYAVIRQSVTVVQDQTLTLNLSYPSMGTLAIQVNNPSGTPASGSLVRVSRPSDGYNYSTRTADSLGKVALSGLTAAIYMVSACYATDRSVCTSVQSAISTDGETVLVPVVLPARATVRVTALHEDGTPYAGLYAYVSTSARPYFQQYGSTDSAGQVSLANIPEGPFKVQLKDPTNGMALTELTGTVGLTDDGGTIDLSARIVRFTGTIRGTVYQADGVTPAGNASVCALNALDSVCFRYVNASPTGVYEMGDVTPGTGGFAVWAHDATYRFEARVDGGSFSGNGDVRTVDVVLPIVTGTVEGYVYAGDGATPIPGAQVTLLHEADYLKGTTTDSTGLYRFAGVAVGVAGFTVRVCTASQYCYGDYLQTGSGAIVSPGGTSALSFTFPGRVGTIEGRVYVFDGVTPVGWTQVSAVALGTDGAEYQLAYAETDATGAYRFSGLLTPEDGVLLRVSSPGQHSNIKAERPVTLPSQGAVLTGVDLVLPINKVMGHVRFADGTPVVSPDVVAYDVVGEEWDDSHADTAGYFEFYEVPPGALFLVAADSWTELSSSRTVEVPAQQVVTADFTLPASNPVRVTVLGPDGAPRPYANVSVLSEGIYDHASMQADATGVALFGRIALGAAYFQAEVYDYSAGQRFAAQAVQVEATGQPLEVTLDLRPAGALAINVLGPAGEPYGGEVWYDVQGFGASGPLGQYSESGSGTSPDGVYQWPYVPPGPVQVVVYDQDGNCGLVNATAVAGETTEVTVTLGTAAYLDYQLAGDDGFLYDVGGDGTIREGGIVGYGYSPYDGGAYELEVFGEGTTWVYAAAPELEGRQLTVGPLTADGVRVTRKVYVPEEGRFARYLDVFSNPTNVARQLSVTVDVDMSYQTAGWAVTPSQSGNTYIVTQESYPSQSLPNVAHVFNGAGAVPVPMTITGEDYLYWFQYRWTVTIPPGSSVALLHFTAQRHDFDVAGAQVQAEALVNLTDPKALFGLTAEEKALIKNFVIR